MHPHAALLTQFYAALSQRDGDAMAACYHPEVHFRDPVFDLRGPRAGAMWRMLCARGKDLTVVASGIAADDDAGAAHWEADYTFSQTGRPVHNVIDAAFTFRDGLVATHRDTFDLWAWTRQALGAPGLLLGWSPVLQNKVRATAAKGLDAYIERHPDALG
ncbi:nuclear transport factor 2 family protein [Rubrivirga sp. IMCC45206]|uniref:nuclear transport factor 2 family protein n=1 Tax=Rubrivirga sp. IMCC45206 TaxID=3391614 RepID=UPI00398FAB0F